MLAAMSLLIEGRQIYAYPFESQTFVLLAFCGVTAFFTSWSGYVVISRLSALTHQLLGQATTGHCNSTRHK